MIENQARLMTKSDTKNIEALYTRENNSQTEQIKITRSLVQLNSSFTAISSLLDFDQVINTLCKEMVNIMEGVACTIYEWDPDNQIANFRAAYSASLWSDDAPSHDSLKLAEYPLTSATLLNNTPMQQTIAMPSISPNERAFMEKYDFQTILLVPLIFMERTFGVMKLYDRNEKTYKNNELLIVDLFLKQAAIAIENAQIHAQVKSEVKSQIRVEENAKYEPLQDPLTGLPNRVLFLDRLQQAMLRNKRDHNLSFSVVYLDLDRFKIVNDTYGQSSGDDLLGKISRVFRNSVREIDTIARFGGDEFLILLEGDTTLEDTEKFAERLQGLLNKQFSIGGHFISTGASIGIVMNSLDYKTPDEYIRDADVAMYRAKSNGRGKYEVFTEDMRDGEYKQLALESDLRRAIKDNEFILHYQPIVSLKNNRIIGFESLVRWKDRKSGEIYPNEFIPLAEESGLIIDLGFWVLYEASRQITKWQNMFENDPPLTVSANISIKQFVHPDFLGEIEQIFQFFDLKPNSLILELNEATMSEDLVDTIHKLHQLGVRVHLDNFGKGALGTDDLKKFPFDAIKIDRSLIGKLGDSPRLEDTVQTIILTADKLGIDIIAQGIETIHQAKILKQVGANYGQGFLFQEGHNSVAMEKYLTQYYQLHGQ